MENGKRTDSLKIAVESIKKGGVILSPTDTIYGLSCDATNAEAIDKIRAIKGRKKEKPFIVLVNSDRLFNQCTADVPEVAWDLIDNASSPLTLVLPASNFLPEVLRPNQMVGIRYVKEGYVADLIHRVNRPIVSTSANLSGEEAAKSFSEIDPRIFDQVDYAVPEEFDQSSENSASKIIRLQANGSVEILRK
ncbi:MAG: threonylcarbamoyl-AMP synthase [Flavobacteriales bacterium]|nr:threonylcarbamoyl-AMP synthase [Flavobacteriales bacterium]